MKRNHIKKLLVLMVFAYSSFAISQTNVTGTVSDDQGPLPGVNIIEKGTTNGVTTDFDGNYTIDVSENATLIFSYIGYTSQEVEVAGRSSINVTMAVDAQALDEVVITGFGSQAKVDVTGAIAQIKQEEVRQNCKCGSYKCLTRSIGRGASRKCWWPARCTYKRYS